MYQLINRCLHRTGKRKHTFGIEIGAPRWPTSVRELALARLMQAVSLIATRDPVRLAGMKRRATRVFAGVTQASDASYDSNLNRILISLETVCQHNLTTERLALLLVHEATHARLSRCGIQYSAPLRNRIERACVRAELSFAQRLPELARHLHTVAISDWLRRPPPDFPIPDL